ncbi:MAG TPA: tail fiber protein [Pyrinomonadaceae bacterium]
MINPYLGEVTVFAFNFAPAGWIACQGQLLSIAEFPTLFSVIGNNFGGDGVSTFGLPNFSSLTDEGGQYCMSLFGTAPTVKRDALPGELALLPYNPPPSWINCDGQLLQVSEYPSLFQILCTAFGGDGTTTFGLPDLRSAPPLLPKGQGGAPPLPPSIYSIANVPSGSTAEGILAEVKLFPSACPPNKWSTCDGQLLPVGSNTGLFSLLQTTYGGDGQTNFALPDFSKLSPPGLQYFICTSGVYPSHPQVDE